MTGSSRIEQLTNGEANRPTKYIVNTFGGSVGGPILKDKLFFFYNYEGQRLATNQTVPQVTPSASFFNGQLGYLAADGSSVLLNVTADCSIGSRHAPSAPADRESIRRFWTIFRQSPLPRYWQPATASTMEVTTSVRRLPSASTPTSARLISPPTQRITSSFAETCKRTPLRHRRSFPGSPPPAVLEDNTKGMAFGYTLVCDPESRQRSSLRVYPAGILQRGIWQGRLRRHPLLCHSLPPRLEAPS